MTSTNQNPCQKTICQSSLPKKQFAITKSLITCRPHEFLPQGGVREGYLIYVPHNGLLSIRSNRNDFDRHFQFFFKKIEISIKLFRKFIFRLHFCHVSFPSLHFYINRFGAIIQVVRELFGFYAVDFYKPHKL